MTPAQSELPPWKPDPRSSALIGGRYQLLDDIGQGATSLIYKARDVVDNRVVALKVLRGSAANHPRLSAGFRREAEVGSRIVHPNVVRIYQSGEHEGWLYLAMEYINGRTLGDMLSMCGRLTLGEADLLIRQTLAALDAIHAQGIVHRDVKPSNIMCNQDGIWKLMDFGISREQGSDATVGPSLGTPEYMSPERLLGRPATASADLYAAGVVFFEALTGEVLFRDRSPVQRCKMPPPGIRELRPETPEWLDALICRVLAPEPAARFQSAASMLSDLRAFEVDRFVEPEVVPPPEPEPVRQNDSRSLADLLRDRPAELGDALGLLSQTLRALIDIETAGGAHEPISPHTLRLTRSGRVEILPHGPGGERDTMLVSSPKYTAPELMHGRILPEARVRADLYALGFVMYEFLLGAALFRAEFPQLQDRGTELGWMEWHSDRGRKPRSVATIVPAVPAQLSQLIDRMLDKDPAKRCASLDEAYRAVQELIGRTQQTQQVQVPAAVRTKKPKRWRTIVTSCAFAAILLAAILLLAKLL